MVRQEARAHARASASPTAHPEGTDIAKPLIAPDILKAITVALAKEKDVPAGTKPKEASPRSGATEKQSIRPARTAIAHARGGNKGK